jgi:HlyD family secretion protein
VAGEAVGLVDTLQLHLRKMQLLGSLKAVDARRYDVGRQVASLRQQIATQKVEQARFDKLVREGASPQKPLDDITAGIVLLEKQLAAQTETLTSGNESLDGETQAMEAQVAQLEDQIAKNIVASPIDGIVLAKYAEQGELAAAGRTLFKVADMTHIFLRVYISADQLTSLKLGQNVRVFADWGEDERREYEGTVSWISDKAEFTPKTIQTRDERANLVYAVKVAVVNDGFVKMGMYGEVRLKVEN